MFFKEFFKNKFNLVLMVLSILSLFPFAVLAKDVMDLMKINDIAHVNEQFTHDVLTRSLMYTPNLIAFILGIFIWVGASATAAIGISKGKIKSVYGFFSLVLGGIAIHIFIFLIFWIKSYFNSKDKKVKVARPLIYLSCVTGAAAAPVALIVVPYVTGSFDDAYEGKPIEISFDAKNPNLLEVFSDGLDRRYQDDLTKMEDFKDFTFFDKFQTVGPLTHRTVPSIYGGFMANNPFAIAKTKGYDPEVKYTYDAYTQNMFATGIEHINKDQDKFGQRTIVNTNTFHKGNWDNYGAFSSGDPRQIVEADKSINVVNWSGARDSISGKWGISNLSPDRASYKWLENNLKAAPATQKGARIYTSDLITHRPFLNDANGNFSLTDTSWEHSKSTAFNSFADMVKALKALENPDKSSPIKNAYDNTMIVIYGDHSSHETVYHETVDIDNTVRKTESLLMIKYPGVNQTSPKVISDRYLYAGQVNRIISDYFTNRIGSDPLAFFADPRFSNHTRPAFTTNSGFIMADWVDDPKYQGSSTEEKLLHQKLTAIGNYVDFKSTDVDHWLDEFKKDEVYYE